MKKNTKKYVWNKKKCARNMAGLFFLALGFFLMLGLVAIKAQFVPTDAPTWVYVPFAYALVFSPLCFMTGIVALFEKK